MKHKHTGWLGAFILVAVLEVWAELSGNKFLLYCTKPLLMPLLGIWFALETAGGRKFARNTVLSALGFSMAGDVMLMFSDGGESGPLFFLLGVGSFLFAQFFYTGFFFSKERRHNGFLRKKPLWALPVLGWTGSLMWQLWPGVPPALHVPVLAYTLTLTAMALSVVNLRGQAPNRVFGFLLMGALLFLLSDSLLAINKFGRPFPAARLVVMLTYLAAQFLLVNGAKRLLQEEKKRQPAKH